MVAIKLLLMTVAVVAFVLAIAATALYRLNKLIDSNEPR
jgi:putative copper export protein